MLHATKLWWLPGSNPSDRMYLICNMYCNMHLVCNIIFNSNVPYNTKILKFVFYVFFNIKVKCLFGSLSFPPHTTKCNFWEFRVCTLVYGNSEIAFYIVYFEFI